MFPSILLLPIAVLMAPFLAAFTVAITLMLSGVVLVGLLAVLSLLFNQLNHHG